ncbi:dual oxidase 2-like [Styela clava]
MKFLILLVTTIVVYIKLSRGEEAEKEYPPYDGWYNNRAHPEWGVVDMPLTRRLPSHYQDGVYQPSGWNRPNPRTISVELMEGETGKNSYQNKTAFLVFFGQQVVEEILDAQRPGCPPEYFNIPIPKNDSMYDRDGTGTVEIPLVRSRYQQAITGYSPNFPRQQLNEITAFIDGGLTYGVSKAWADALRLLKDKCIDRNASTNIFSSDPDPTDCRGELASYNDEGRLPVENSIGLPLANPPPPRDHVLKSSKRFYRLGNPRGNENPFLLTFGVLWFRHHNYLARRVRQSHPEYSDEKVFNEARILNIAIHQRIIMYEWLPIFLGECGNSSKCQNISDYTGYKSSVHPGITHVFQSAAMRFGHTLVPPGVFRRTAYNPDTKTCEFLNTTRFTAGDRHGFEEKHVGNKGLRTCNTYWNSIEAVSEDKNAISALLMGMASQICEREDNIITPDLRGSVFGPLEFSRRDLMAINIQRGRDHGLPDYNTARESLGLERRNTFEEVNPEFFNDDERDGPKLLKKFIDVHNGNIDNVDIWTGGLLETTKTGPGELFRAIILDQFTRIRDGDRFWFENDKNGLLNKEDLEFVWNTTIKDVVLRTNPEMTEQDIQDMPFVWNPASDANALCPQPFPLSELDMEECTDVEKYDYFTGSELSFALSFAAIGLYVILMLLLLLVLGKRGEANRSKLLKKGVKQTCRRNITEGSILAREILGKQDRQIQLNLGPGMSIQIKSLQGNRLRTIDLGRTKRITLMQSHGGTRHIFVIRAEETETYDLVLSFMDSTERNNFQGKLSRFLNEEGIQSRNEVPLKEHALLECAKTKEKRDAKLQKCFRDVFAVTVKMESSSNVELPEKLYRYLDIKLSKKEFADYMKLKQDSLFIDQIFEVTDSDKDGFISFREFFQIMVLFYKGSVEDRWRLMFEMYDLNKSGYLSKEDFTRMLRSMNADVEAADIDELVKNMMEECGFGNQSALTLQDFQTIMGQYSNEMNETSHGRPDSTANGAARQRVGTLMHQHPIATRVRSAKQTIRRAYQGRDANQNANGIASGRGTVIVSEKQKQLEQNKYKIALILMYKYIQNYRMHIFWLATYTMVAWAIFAERVYYFSVEREHAGLRRICGYGVSITRGAASGMMFTYSCLLVTMSRNTITFLRETFLHRYIPFDSAVTMHRYIAWLAMIFTVIHIVGHSVNFYSISTQPASDVACLFPDYWRTSDDLPTFHYWCWQTITGIAGVVCTLIVITMYVFASDYSRRRIFQYFWWTHSFGYVLLYLFMVLHGSGFLVQRPYFYYFFLGPAVLYTLDKLYSISRKKTEISVINAELLPSEVTYLEFKRPPTFDYRAGQWVRIACLDQSSHEYHPFTLTSAPSEETLKLHIRAVGPWTMNLRRLYENMPYPKLFLDGPFGEGHQDWYKFEVSVLVGGGIGVTPFASILKDLIEKSANGFNVRCKKVFFMWITKDQKQYEWLTDIIQKVESADRNHILDTHIFITQFQQKFDFRTTMMYICERKFQKEAGKSLFTGLRAITHFGRPNFDEFFNSLSEEYSQVKEFGVFSCGPSPMTHTVDNACSLMNKIDGPTFLHHFENF